MFLTECLPMFFTIGFSSVLKKLIIKNFQLENIGIYFNSD
jgi:hypothetical protein